MENLIKSKGKKFLILPNPFYKKLKSFKSLRIIPLPPSECLKKTKPYYHNFLKKKQQQFYNVVSILKTKKTNDSNLSKFLSKSSFRHKIFSFLKFPFYSKIFRIAAFVFLTFISFYILINKKYKITDLSGRTVKFLILRQIFRNKSLEDKISHEILVLCQSDKIKILLRDLIIQEILPNKELKEDLYGIIKREIIAYLQSQECRRELNSLLINDVLRNEDIRNELFELIKEFITIKEVSFLEEKLEKILVDVLSIEAIHIHVAKKIEEEVNKILRDEEIVKMAINLILGEENNNVNKNGKFKK